MPDIGFARAPPWRRGVDVRAGGAFSAGAGAAWGIALASGATAQSSGFSSS